MNIKFAFTMAVLSSVCFFSQPVFCAENSWDQWEFRQTIQVSDVSGSTAALALQGPVYDGSRPDLGDLRVADDRMAPVPYTIVHPAEGNRTRSVPGKVMEKKFDAEGSMIAVDFDKVMAMREVRIVSSSANLIGKATIMASEDGVQWQPVLNDVVIYSFRGLGHASYFASLTREDYSGFSFDGFASEKMIVAFPEIRCRYLKVALARPGGLEPAELQGLEVFETENLPSHENSYSGKITSVKPVPEEKSVWVTVDLGHKNLPLHRLEIQASGINYFRNVIVESGNDGQHWEYAGSGAVFSISLDNEPASQNRIPLSVRQARFLRLKIINGDNAPIRLSAVQAYGPRHWVVFLPKKGEKVYSLYYGNPQALRPQYDISTLLSQKPFESFGLAETHPPDKNPDYHFRPASDVPKPWTENKPYLLIGLLAAIILGLLFLALQVVRKIDEK